MKQLNTDQLKAELLRLRNEHEQMTEGFKKMELQLSPMEAEPNTVIREIKEMLKIVINSLARIEKFLNDTKSPPDAEVYFKGMKWIPEKMAAKMINRSPRILRKHAKSGQWQIDFTAPNGRGYQYSEKGIEKMMKSYSTLTSKSDL